MMLKEDSGFRQDQILLVYHLCGIISSISVYLVGSHEGILGFNITLGSWLVIPLLELLFKS